MHILQLIGYFAAFTIGFVANSLIIGGLLTLFAIPVVDAAFLCAGVLTVVECVISAIVHYNYWENRSDVDKKKIVADQEYRMELLRIGEEEAAHRREMEAARDRQEASISRSI